MWPGEVISQRSETNWNNQIPFWFSAEEGERALLSKFAEFAPHSFATVGRPPIASSSSVIMGPSL